MAWGSRYSMFLGDRQQQIDNGRYKTISGRINPSGDLDNR